jgi:RNA polymerase sigma-70 factor (ECF subfamily)
VKLPETQLRIKSNKLTSNVPEEDSDESLMLQLCQGDMRSFERLFQRYGAAVRGYLGRWVRPENAEDLTQTTFLSLLRGRGRFDPKAKFKPWLYAIATNAARDHLRRRRPEELTATGELPPLPSEATTVSERDEGLERAVQQALSQLPERLRLPILLHRFQHLSFSEIAQALDASESAVKVRAHRGYKRLRVLLQGLREDQ